MSVSSQVVSAAERRVGTLLKGKWTIDAVLGTGGMATVYAATHRNKKRVAIKVLHPEVALSDDVTSRFLREGYVANTVDHPGAVTVLDDDVTDDGAPFLVMELLEGETIEQRRERKGGRLSASEVLWAAEQVLDVLVAAHGKGVVHRDLKPENIFVTSDHRLKVLDFGIARLRDVSLGASVGTQTGSLLGTPAYMSPEQARGRSELVDARTDIWAVGALMFTLLAGRPVHEAQTLNEQLIYAATKPAPSIGEVMAELPRELAAVIDRSLAFEKEDRYADAASMLEAVKALCDKEGRLTSLSMLPPGVGPRSLASMALPVSTAKTSATMSIPPTGSMPPRSAAEAALTSGPAARPGGRRMAFVAIAAVASAATLGLVLLARSPQATPSAVAETTGSPPSSLVAQPTSQPAAHPSPSAPAASVAGAGAEVAPPSSASAPVDRPAAPAGTGAKGPHGGHKTPSAPTPPSPPTPATTTPKPPTPPVTATAPQPPPAGGNPFDRRF